MNFEGAVRSDDPRSVRTSCLTSAAGLEHPSKYVARWRAPAELAVIHDDASERVLLIVERPKVTLPRPKLPDQAETPELAIDLPLPPRRELIPS